MRLRPPEGLRMRTPGRPLFPFYTSPSGPGRTFSTPARGRSPSPHRTSTREEGDACTRARRRRSVSVGKRLQSMSVRTSQLRAPTRSAFRWGGMWTPASRIPFRDFWLEATGEGQFVARSAGVGRLPTAPVQRVRAQREGGRRRGHDGGQRASVYGDVEHGAGRTAGGPSGARNRMCGTGRGRPFGGRARRPANRNRNHESPIAIRRGTSAHLRTAGRGARIPGASARTPITE